MYISKNNGGLISRCRQSKKPGGEGDVEAGEEWHPGKWLTMKLVVIGAEKALAGRFADWSLGIKESQLYRSHSSNTGTR